MIKMNKMIEDILENYNIPGKIVEIKQNNTGNINKTYIIKYIDKNKEKNILFKKSIHQYSMNHTN